MFNSYDTMFQVLCDSLVNGIMYCFFVVFNSAILVFCLTVFRRLHALYLVFPGRLYLKYLFFSFSFFFYFFSKFFLMYFCSVSLTEHTCTCIMHTSSTFEFAFKTWAQHTTYMYNLSLLSYFHRILFSYIIHNWA